MQAASQPSLGEFSKRKVIHECVEIAQELVEEFREWLLKDNPNLRESTLRQNVYYIPRLVGLELCGEEDVGKVFSSIELNKISYEAFSRFLTFLEKTKDFDELVVKLRKGIPKKPVARADTYVPLDEPVLKARENIKKFGAPYTLIYNVLVSSG